MAPIYTEMAAKMRERPTFAVAEKVLQQDFKLKLPSRTFIRLIRPDGTETWARQLITKNQKTTNSNKLNHTKHLITKN